MTLLPLLLLLMQLLSCGPEACLSLVSLAILPPAAAGLQRVELEVVHADVEACDWLWKKRSRTGGSCSGLRWQVARTSSGCVAGICKAHVLSALFWCAVTHEDEERSSSSSSSSSRATMVYCIFDCKSQHLHFRIHCQKAQRLTHCGQSTPAEWFPQIIGQPRCVWVTLCRGVSYTSYRLAPATARSTG